MPTPLDPRGADVTVVTPAYRAEKTIGRTLRSIAAQDEKPRRVVVVDDGSDDGTLAELASFEGALAGIELVVLRQDHKGPGAARNRGLERTETPLVAFLDADDEWLPAKLACSLAALSDPSVALVSHDMVVIDGSGEQRVDCARHLVNGADPFVALFKRGFVATSTVVARVDAVRACGGFDESLPSGQDYELWLAMARAGNRLVVLPNALTRYHVTAGSVTSFVERRRRCSLSIAARHAAGLKGRTSFPLATAVARAMIVSYEAASAHLANGKGASALGAALQAPAAAIGVIAGRKSPKMGLSAQASE